MLDLAVRFGRAPSELINSLTSTDFVLLAAKNAIDPIGPQFEEFLHAKTQALIATHLNTTLYANGKTRQRKKYSVSDFMRKRKQTDLQKSKSLLNGLKTLSRIKK